MNHLLHSPCTVPQDCYLRFDDVQNYKFLKLRRGGHSTLVGPSRPPHMIWKLVIEENVERYERHSSAVQSPRNIPHTPRRQISLLYVSLKTPAVRKAAPFWNADQEITQFSGLSTPRSNNLL